MKTRILQSSRAGIFLLLMAVSQAGGQSSFENPVPAAAALAEVGDALQRVFSRIRFTGEPLAGRRGASGAEALLGYDRQHVQSRVTGEKEFSPPILSETVALEEAATILGKIREIRELLRAPNDAPMSELSAPILRVRAVSMESSDRATACVYLDRIGSMISVRLAAYNVSVAKTKQEWRLTSVSSDGSCQRVNYYPLFVTYPTWSIFGDSRGRE